MSKIRNLLFPITFGLLLTSCISTQKFNEIVLQKYTQDTTIQEIPKSNYISFNLSKIPENPTLVKSKNLKSIFIPAVIFWQWENTISWELNPRKYGNFFCAELSQYADSINLEYRLDGKKIEIILENIPNRFIYTHKGYTVILIISYLYNDIEAIFPEKQELRLTYKLYSDTTTIKENTIYFEYPDKPLVNVWKSTKKLTWTYIDQYEFYLKKLSQIVTQEISNDLPISNNYSKER